MATDEIEELFANRRLVVFDVDGTLYNQQEVRWRMALRIIGATLATRSLCTLRVVRSFRKIREALADAETRAFDGPLHARTAAATGCSEPEIRAIIQEWMEARPLDVIARSRVPGAAELFQALRERGVVIGVLSDYPARAKLSALSLEADLIVAATDPEIGVMKPLTKGLEALLDRSGCQASEALMVGDRSERDGLVARRLGVPFLLRSWRPTTEAPRTVDFVRPAAIVSQGW